MRHVSNVDNVIDYAGIIDSSLCGDYVILQHMLSHFKTFQVEVWLLKEDDNKIPVVDERFVYLGADSIPSINLWELKRVVVELKKIDLLAGYLTTSMKLILPAHSL